MLIVPFVCITIKHPSLWEGLVRLYSVNAAFIIKLDELT